MRKKSKIEKGFLALLATPDIIAVTFMLVAGIIYLFLS